MPKPHPIKLKSRSRSAYSAEKLTTREAAAKAPSETAREDFERAEHLRIKAFIKDNSDLPHPSDLGAIIKTDNGRLRLWFEISEHTSLAEDKQRLDQLKKWKYRLVRFDRNRDFQPHPIQFILERVEQASKDRHRKKHVLIAKEINSWIANRLYDWEKGTSQLRTMVDAELFGVLKLFGIDDDEIEEILNKAQSRIGKGLYPFVDCRAGNGRLIGHEEQPVRPQVLKSLVRTWKKKQLPL